MADRTIILIDGDIIANKASYAAETRWYEVQGTTFKYKKEADKYIKDKGLEAEPELCKSVLPASMVYKMTDSLIMSICKNVEEDNVRIFIGPPSGTKTFRHEAAVTAPYKGNRKPGDRAIHLDKARDYLVSKHQAEVVLDMEVDDMLGILQEPDGTIIASIDKDLLQIPGWHYNIDSKKMTFVEEPGTLFITKRKDGKLDLKGTGFKWFCAQMLLGDPVDNIIKPKKGIGARKIHNLLKDDTDPKKMWEKVAKVYKSANINYEENATLLWILRDKDKTWRDEL